MNNAEQTHVNSNKISKGEKFFDLYHIKPYHLMKWHQPAPHTDTQNLFMLRHRASNCFQHGGIEQFQQQAVDLEQKNKKGHDEVSL